METFSPPHPTIGLVPQLYHQLVYTLTGLLPPPLDDALEALRIRNHRGAIDGAAAQDAWALHIAERSMLGAVDPDAGPQQAAWPDVAQAADVDQRIEQHVSEDGTKSQDVAFETWLSAQFPDRGAARPDGSWLHEVVREAIADKYHVTT